MKAAVCYDFTQPLVIEDIDIDDPKADEVQVQIAATAICHSDVHLVRGEWGNWSTQPPVVAGHEAAGTIVKVGPGVTRVQPGDPVVVTLQRFCGTCFFCTIGTPYLCEGKLQFALASESRLRNKRGQAIAHGVSTAAFAERAVVHHTQVVKLPPDMPLDRACLLACGVITGFGAVTNTAVVETGSSVAVIGTGGVGLNSVQGAALSGANPIIAIDILDAKLDAARHFGATHGINARGGDVRAQVRALTDGRGADYVFVTIGSEQAVSQGLQLLRRQGKLVLVGMPREGACAPLPIGDFVYDGQSIIGSNLGSARIAVDIPRLVALYQGGRLKLDELITARYPLEGINDAIERMERGEALRNVIIF
jgi:S-(hydroxymethyl)glutathione dehydrogenase / alcohol dehydrogenase